MSTHKHSWVSCYGAISAYKCSRVPIALQNHIHACSWAPMIVHFLMVPRSWVFMVTHECSWAIMSFYKYPISTHEYEQPWAAMSAHYCSWSLLSSHEYSWALCHGAMGTHGSSGAVMIMGSWAMDNHSHSFTLIELYHHAHDCPRVLISADGRWWKLMSAHKSSWMVTCFFKQ